MQPFALSITQSLGIVLCYLSLAAHLTTAIWSSDRPKSRNKVSIAVNARGTKQNVGLIDEAMQGLGLDEFFGIHDPDNDDDSDSDEDSDEYKVKNSNTKGHSTSIKHKDRKSSNKKWTKYNRSNNNSNRSKGEQDKPAPSFYGDIEKALGQATDKVESLWLQFKQGIHNLMPDLSHHENDNSSEEDEEKEQIKPIQIKPTSATTTTKKEIETTSAGIETTTERSIKRIRIATTSSSTTEKPPSRTTSAIKIITDNPLTNGAIESLNAEAEKTTKTTEE